MKRKEVLKNIFIFIAYFIGYEILIVLLLGSFRSLPETTIGTIIMAAIGLFFAYASTFSEKVSHV